MTSRALRHASRWIQLVGILVALLGLLGLWLNRDVARTPLSVEAKALLGVSDEETYASFVVAGRDVFYEEGKSEPVYGAGGEIVCWRYTGAKNLYGTNTDTILYVSIIGNDITLIYLNRDLFLGSGSTKINAAYALGGPERLRQAVEDLLGVPVDYYAIINIGIFQRLVDALGGVTVDVPTRMYHRDCAADLTIDLHPGVQVLNGEEASHFVRFRGLRRGDINRVDNVKALVYGLLARVKELHVRAAARLPRIASVLLENVETNVTPALIRELLPRIPDIRIRTSSTFPTTEVFHGGVYGLEADQHRLREFLASTFGGAAVAIAQAPSKTLLITNRCGTPGVEDWYRDRLLHLGVPEERITTRTDDPLASESRLVATFDTWDDATYYANLLHVSRQQIDRFARRDGDIGFELVLSATSMACTPPGFHPARRPGPRP